MEKLYSKIIGTPVLLESGGRPIAKVVDLVIDPENGKIVAFSVAPANQKLISPNDVVEWNDSLVIRNYDDIVEADDLLRAQEVIDMHKPIMRNKVVSQKDGKSLGHVFDYIVHSQLLVLKKIYVGKGIFGLIRWDVRIIPHAAIYEVLPNKIIVNTDAEILDEEENEEGQKALNLGAI